MKIVPFGINAKSAAVGFILLLAASAISAILPAAFAQVIAVPDKTTTCNLSVAPKVIGLGQKVLVTLWVAPSPNNALVFAQGGGYRYYNISITFTKPDGSTDTFMPQEGHGVNPPGQTDRLGGIWFQYKPDQVGNWSVKFSFPGLTIYDPPGYSEYYKPSTSPTTTFTVQEEQVLAGLLNGGHGLRFPVRIGRGQYQERTENGPSSQEAGSPHTVTTGLVKSAISSIRTVQGQTQRTYCGKTR